MDFAKRQLEKYGWQEGSGLGKHATGISTAIKPTLKFDNAGIGHSSSDQFTNNWWENLYNKSSTNINVVVENDEVKLGVKDKDAVNISTKKDYAKIKNNSDLEYGSFIKTSKLTETGIVNLDNKFQEIEAQPSPVITTLTDEQLFAACGGRTAHKGARHGLKLNGKLSRIEMQEKLLLKQLNKFTLSDDNSKGNKKNIEKKLRKIKYHKSKNIIEEDMWTLPPSNPCILNINSPNKINKKRRSERKHVSFSETVVEYQPPENDTNERTNNVDLDSSSHSEGTSKSLSPVSKAKEVKINDNSDNPSVMTTDLDEGIDCSDYDSNKERTKHELQEKIRKENRKMKRKLKKIRKLNRIQETSKQHNLESCDKSITWAKRKLFEEPELSDSLKSKRCHYEGYESKRRNTMLLKQQQQLEKNFEKVASSFDNICKISGVRNE